MYIRKNTSAFRNKTGSKRFEQILYVSQGADLLPCFWNLLARFWLSPDIYKMVVTGNVSFLIGGISY